MRWPALELQTIHNAAKDDSADVNVYFVQAYQCPLAAYHVGLKAIFALGFEDQSPPELNTRLLLAHELGHHLGLLHCDSMASIDNNCGGQGKSALMHESNTGCWLHKPEWDCTNAMVGCPYCV
jgi:hypothetical protein